MRKRRPAAALMMTRKESGADMAELAGRARGGCPPLEQAGKAIGKLEKTISGKKRHAIPSTAPDNSQSKRFSSGKTRLALFLILYYGHEPVNS